MPRNGINTFWKLMYTRSKAKKKNKTLYEIKHTVPLSVIKKCYDKNYLPPITPELIEKLLRQLGYYGGIKKAT